MKVKYVVKFFKVLYQNIAFVKVKYILKILYQNIFQALFFLAYHFAFLPVNDKVNDKVVLRNSRYVWVENA